LGNILILLLNKYINVFADPQVRYKFISKRESAALKFTLRKLLYLRRIII